MYASPKLYTLAMRVLYWPHFADRYRVVADLIPPGSTVVDACCGDAYIYTEYLQRKGVQYVGLDSSPAMVKAGIESGLDIRLWNALEEEVPTADVVLMQGALCHFIPDTAPIVKKLCVAAREMVIISEPIRPKPHSDVPLLSKLSKTFTQPLNDNGSYRGDRFTKEELQNLLQAMPGFISSQVVPGGREMVGVLHGQKRKTS
ncbi:MAG: class I SAM-dependent methyltransferase [Deltaproteobacteria bacterium]|nr:class I SAM-dependent methyltransferase [Deltaproteobacteria bacterium]